MSLRIVGAGLGRTGTHSLQVALQQLLDAPCYHMLEVIAHPEFVTHWEDAQNGKPVDWAAVMNGYTAAVDWPASAYWAELAEANPDAIVLLSTRSSAGAWYKSANDTIFEYLKTLPDDQFPKSMLGKKFTPDWQNPEAAMRAYEAHNANVRASVPPERLVDWQPGDGWELICNALGLPVPDTEFPHVNTTDDFRAMVGLDPQAGV